MAKGKSPLKRLGLLLLLLLVIAFTWNGPGLAAENTNCPEQIILTWTSDPQTTQTVAWRVNSSVSSGKVQYMKASEKTQDFSGAQEKEAICSELYTGFNHFEAQLDNLQAGTTYAYRVGSEGGWSTAATFTTAAATDQFSFMYMGDTHIGYNQNSSAVWKQLLNQALTAYPDIKFTLQGGDLVDKTKNIAQWEEFFNTAAGVFDRLAFMPAMGNHEFDDTSIYLKSFALPQNGPEGLKEHHYSFDYGNAHFVVLDSNLMGSEGELSIAGMNWLQNDLQNSNKKWKFVMFHHPPYGVDSRDVTQGNLVKASWVPIMERNGVDMVFVGHQHLYMRTYPICQEKIQETSSQGITYVLGDASNKTYLNPEQHDYIAVVKAGTDATGYTVISINGDVLTMTTRALNGTIMDEFKINKSSDMDSRVSIDSVKLLDNSYQEISSISTSGCCRLKAHLINHSSKTQTVVALFQLRSGNGATQECGGESLGISSLQAEIPAEGADVYVDFNLNNVSPGTAYVDVYLLDEADVPIDVPCEYSFTISS